MLPIIELGRQEDNDGEYLGGMFEGQSGGSGMPKGLSKARRAWSEENLQSEMPFLKILSFSSCGKLSDTSHSNFSFYNRRHHRRNTEDKS